MQTYVIDHSLLSAILNSEIENSTSQKYLQHSVISSINLMNISIELMQKNSLLEAEIAIIINNLVSNVINFDQKQAFLAAKLSKNSDATKENLSTCDRACISLGMALDLPICTIKKSWANLQIDGVKIIVIK